MQTDWREATTTERKILYRVAKSLVDDGRFTWDQLYESAFGRRFRRGLKYEADFGSGRISRERAAMIYRWLRANFPGHADRVDSDIAALYGAPAAPTTWEAFIDRHGTFAGLRALRQERQSPMEPEFPAERDASGHLVQVRHEQHQIRRYSPRDDVIHDRIALDHPFFFRLTSPMAGHAIGLQWVRGHWYTLPLGGKSVAVPVVAGEQNLPRSLSLYDHALIEQSEAGLHRVVFLILPDDTARFLAARITLDDWTPPALLDDAATRIGQLPKETWHVLRMNVMFVASDSSGGLL